MSDFSTLLEAITPGMQMVIEEIPSNTPFKRGDVAPFNLREDSVELAIKMGLFKRINFDTYELTEKSVRIKEFIQEHEDV